jgi:hypothetical protein
MKKIQKRRAASKKIMEKTQTNRVKAIEDKTIACVRSSTAKFLIFSKNCRINGSLPLCGDSTNLATATE